MASGEAAAASGGGGKAGKKGGKAAAPVKAEPAAAAADDAAAGSNGAVKPEPVEGKAEPGTEAGVPALLLPQLTRGGGAQARGAAAAGPSRPPQAPAHEAQAVVLSLREDLTALYQSLPEEAFHEFWGSAARQSAWSALLERADCPQVGGQDAILSPGVLVSCPSCSAAETCQLGLGRCGVPWGCGRGSMGVTWSMPLVACIRQPC
jgi:hypothetical protein